MIKYINFNMDQNFELLIYSLRMQCLDPGLCEEVSGESKIKIRDNAIKKLTEIADNPKVPELLKIRARTYAYEGVCLKYPINNFKY